MSRRRNAVTAARAREDLRAALRRVDAGGLALDQLRVFLDHLADAGFSRRDVAAYVAEHVERWAEDYCQQSDRLLVRRCGDTIGDVAEAVTENVLSRRLPS